MSDNPFVGTKFELSWDQGFLAAFALPDTDIEAPSPLTLNQQEAYLQGVLAGRLAGAGLRVPHAPTENDLASGWREVSHALIEVAEIAGHIRHQWSIGRGVTAIGLLPEIAASVLFTVAIWGPTSVPTPEEAAQAALNRLRLDLQANGVVEDNIELFMPVCLLPEHKVMDNDELTRLGCWRGRVYLTFDDALVEAIKHKHPDNTRILRYQSALPHVLDIIQL